MLQRIVSVMMIGLLLMPLAARSVAPDMPVYDEGLAPGWEDWSWCTRDLWSTATVHSGAYAIAATMGPWEALSFHHEPFSTSGYESLALWVHGGEVRVGCAGEAGGQDPGLSLFDAAGDETSAVCLADYLPAGRILPGAWQRAVIPLADLRALGVTISRVDVFEHTGTSVPMLYLDDIRFLGSTDTQPPVVSGLTTKVGGKTIIVTWRTDEPATSLVEYGPTPALGQTSPHDYRLRTDHMIFLTNLAPEVPVYLRAGSFDASGNMGVSEVVSATPAPPVPPIDPKRQAGMSYACWWEDCYGRGGSDAALELLPDDCVGWVSIVNTWYQDTITSTNIYSTSHQTPTDAVVKHAVDKAHSLGLQVMLKPHVDLAADDAHWRGQIGTAFTTEAEWAIWFDSYRAFITHNAALAQAWGVEQFCVGTELVGTSARESDWRSMVAAVRAVYPGRITYATNWGGEEVGLAWWDALDYIGVDAYYPLTDKDDPTLDELRTAWITPTQTLAGLATAHNKRVILTEIGYRSLDGANRHPWDWQATGPVDLGEQADCYQAVFESLWGQPWFAGMYWWSWDATVAQGGPADNTYTPHRKPAEAVLRRFYCDLRPIIYLPLIRR